MKILSPKGFELRPTSGKVRAAVLNSLQADLADAHFLDLFAGTGAIGLEALSRGAKAATFVEKDRQALRLLKANIESLEMRFTKNAFPPPRCALVAMDAFAFAEKSGNAKWDIVWLDPPYEQEDSFWPKLAASVEGLLVPNGKLVIEASKRNADKIEKSFADPSWAIVKEKTYGDTFVLMLTLNSSYTHAI